MRIKMIGHSTLVIEGESTKLITDQTTTAPLGTLPMSRSGGQLFV